MIAHWFRDRVSYFTILGANLMIPTQGSVPGSAIVMLGFQDRVTFTHPVRFACSSQFQTQSLKINQSCCNSQKNKRRLSWTFSKTVEATTKMRWNVWTWLRNVKQMAIFIDAFEAELDATRKCDEMSETDSETYGMYPWQYTKENFWNVYYLRRFASTFSKSESNKRICWNV